MLTSSGGQMQYDLKGLVIRTGIREEKLKKEIEGLKRCDPDTERKVITFINEEKEKGNVGFGSIFGG